MSSERKPKAVIASRDSRSPTLSVVVPDPAWEPSSSPRSEKSTQTDRWSPTPSCHPPRSLIPLLSHTTPLSPSISSLRTPTTSCASITKPFTISASEPSSSPPQPTVILTISSLPPSPVSHAALDSQDSSTLTSESSPSTSCHSPDTDATLPPPPSSEDACPPRKSTSRCSTSRTRTLLTSSSGSPTTSSHPSVTSHPRDSRWPLLSSETPPPSRRCSRELESSSPPCSEERRSSIGTPAKAWTRWSSPRLSPT